MADNKQRETTKDNEQQPAEVKDHDKQNASSSNEEASTNNEPTTEEKKSENEANTPETKPAPTPTLAEDYEQLKKLHLLKDIMIRQKAGRHPSTEIDALLKRRMNFKNEDFQGPYVVRLISTLLMIFVFAAIFWSVLWILASGFNLTYFIRLLSTGMATLVAAIAGIAVFFPSSLPNEAILKKAIDLKMKEIGNEVEPDKTVKEAPESQEELLDSNIATKQKKEETASPEESSPLSPMPEGLNKFKEQKEKPLNSESELSSEESSVEENEQSDNKAEASEKSDEANSKEKTENKEAQKAK